MSNPEYIEFLNSKRVFDQPSGFQPSDLSPALFDFQSAIVRWACQRGRAAIFAGTGLGKTLMQTAWADQVMRHTGQNVLILAPLCVAQQTVKEAEKIGVTVRYCRSQESVQPGITIANYEMLEHFDTSAFVGVVLDESGILKAYDGKTRNAIITQFRNTPYRLSCTATPAPNDYMELGNQAEFIGVMSRTEMLAMFFTHDGGNTSKWRLKKHGQQPFWEWLSSWAVYIQHPRDLGFEQVGFDLPPLQIHEHIVDSTCKPEDALFAIEALTLSDRREAKRNSLVDRVQKAMDLITSHNRPAIVWCLLNDESSALKQAIPDAVEIYGALSLEEKERRIQAFTTGQARILISKPSITGWGMNWQHCADMVFASIDDSFEAIYQAIRRCYRFGQTSPVNVHLITSEGEGAVKNNIENKQRRAEAMMDAMSEHMQQFSEQAIKKLYRQEADYITDVNKGDDWEMHLGDCVEVASGLERDSVDYIVFSPPFSSLYTYSNSHRDMGNCMGDNQFFSQFRFLIRQLYRTLKPGRLLSFHCMNLPTSKQNHGYIGIRDFRGDLIREFEAEGFIYHSEVCIWKDPVTAMQRTKALGLLYKQLRKDSCMSRQGLPDYLVTMRKPGENKEPVTKTHDGFPVSLWQRYASPVWMDINPSRTLQYQSARESDDERHIAPLQLDVIERAIELWSNPGDLVFSPFAGIGSELYVAIQMGRKALGAELKQSYFEIACKNLLKAKRVQGGLFAEIEAA